MQTFEIRDSAVDELLMTRTSETLLTEDFYRRWRITRETNTYCETDAHFPHKLLRIYAKTINHPLIIHAISSLHSEVKWEAPN